jgi:hypothetical protein
MKRNGRASAFVRPAILEAVLLCTLGGAAILEVVAGSRMHCTALVEFGALSAIAGGSAGALSARYCIEICGFLADYRWFERWGARLGTVAYISLALYALANGVLDLAVPRRDPDFVSYSGLLWTVAAVVVVTLVLQTKYRALEDLPSLSLFDSVSQDTFYLCIGIVTLGTLVAHVFVPVWWLDTATDAIFVVLIAYRLERLHQDSLRSS